jgi:hypothetical protein
VTILTACSRVTGLAIGAPALIAASCLIAAARYRRVSPNKSIDPIACPPLLHTSRYDLDDIPEPSIPQIWVESPHSCVAFLLPIMFLIYSQASFRMRRRRGDRGVQSLGGGERPIVFKFTGAAIGLDGVESHPMLPPARRQEC